MVSCNKTQSKYFGEEILVSEHAKLMATRWF